MRSKLLLAFLSFSLLSFSQDSSFQLKDYKYRTEGYKALSLVGGMGGSFSQTSNGDPSYHDEMNRRFDFQPFSVTYYKTYNRENRIHTTDIYLTGSYNSTHQEIDKSVIKRKYLTSFVSWENDDLFYKGKRFFEVGALVTNQLLYSKNTDSIGHRKNTNFGLHTAFVLGYGRGRIENVRDAQMAMFIINDLQHQGLLPANIDAQTYQELSNLVTQINNKRVFDDRRKRIYELTQIDSFIKSKGLVSTTDIRHFTVINDNWTLASNPQRLSGKRWFVRLKPGAGLEYQKNDDNRNVESLEKENGKIFTAGGETGFEQYIPVDLHFQHSWRVSAFLNRNWDSEKTESVYNGQTSKSEYSDNSWVSGIEAHYQFDFYPNNRTIVSAFFEATLNRVSGNEYEQSFDVIPSLGFSTSYFLGYRTRLYANASFSNYHLYSKNSQAKNNIHQLGANLSVAIQHSIF